jgi:acetylornithine deacetylase/succinyl-diaminopimelate desuccinylase-like protein
MLVPILAAEALYQTTGTLPVNVKFFFEGQEEIGSPQLAEFVTGHRELLACDMVLAADGSQGGENQPILLTGRRGLCALQIDIQGAERDVHSGTYGGSFLNPIHALVQLLSSLHDEQGKVRVEGFYDAVASVSQEERRMLAEASFDEDAFRTGLGVPRLFGEPSFTPMERIGIRPTLEINGIGGGFQGEGVKTVIPATAHAKITCRLVPDQDPDDIVEKVASQIRKNASEAVTVRVTSLPGGGLPYRVAADHPGNRAAASVLARLYGTPPNVARMGGTIPVCGIFLRHLNASTIHFSFGLSDENIHAPDEFFRLESFRRGQRAYCMMLEEIPRHG